MERRSWATHRQQFFIAARLWHGMGCQNFTGMTSSLRLLQNIGLGALFLVLPVATAGPLFETVTAFERGPEKPGSGDLVLHTDGSFYGVSYFGGPQNYGTIYKVTPGGELDAVATFTGDGSEKNGRYPLGLVSDGEGFLWGTTDQGVTTGSGEGYGTIFKMNPVTGQVTTVAVFNGFSGPNKGKSPSSVLASDGTGYVWGTTARGGGWDAGTVLKINIHTGALTTIVEFTGTSGTAKGRSPYAKFVSDGNGFMWGTTTEGGAGNFGTIYKVNVSTGAFTTVAEFTGPIGAAKGSHPRAGLASDGNGNFWGTTSGQSSTGWVSNGTVFKLHAVTGTLTSIISFTDTIGATKGRQPLAGLVSDGAGFLWGTTYAGGATDRGTVFKVNLSTSEFLTVVEFNSTAIPEGSNPMAGLVMDGSGFLWGTTSGGGLPSGLGTVFKVNPATGALATVTGFLPTTGKGTGPMAGLVSDGTDWLWSTATAGGIQNGGSGHGTIFKVNARNGALRKVAEFTGQNGLPATARGQSPYCSLLDSGNGFFWGTTRDGGERNLGTLFKVQQSTGDLTNIMDFGDESGPIKGFGPIAGLENDGSGFFWGTTENGGTGNNGTIYKVNSADGALATVLEFTGTDGEAKGSEPGGRLLDNGVGDLWGTTRIGGVANAGTIFKINRDTGTLNTVIEFTGVSGTNRGSQPYAELVHDGAGFFWGTTLLGGAANSGTIFKLNESSGQLSTLVQYTGANGPSKGLHPQAGLASDGRGSLWGTTNRGGAGHFGTIFKITLNGAFSSVFDFTGSAEPVRGSGPGFGPLFLHTDGHLYGTTRYYPQSTSGSLGYGQVYRLRFGPVPATLPPKPIGSTSARLRGQMNPNGYATTAAFEYGTDAALVGSSVAGAGTTGNGTAPVDVFAKVTGLSPATTYQCRLRGLNAENPNVQEGQILSFITAPLGFAGWAGDFGLSDTSAAANADPDGDRLQNAVEYVLGVDPTNVTTTEPLTVSIQNGSAIITFLRADRSETPDITVEVETGPNLTTWPSRYVVGADTASSSPEVGVSENGGDPDTVTVTVALGLNSKLFARLRVTVAP